MKKSELQMDLQSGRVFEPYLGLLRARNEVAALNFIRENTDIPVPEVIVAFQDDEVFYSVVRYVDGILMDKLSESDAAKVVEELDRYLAELAKFTSDEIKSFVGEPCFPPRLLYGLRTRAPGTFVKSPSQEYVLCHGDLARHNVIVDPKTLKIAALIDWEYAGFYPPEVEYRFYLRPEPSGKQASEMKGSTHELLRSIQALWD